MARIVVDRHTIEVKQGVTVLQAAGKAGIQIPALCAHPGLEPLGACRLCLVEVTAGGKPGLAASCTLPATDGLVLETGSERVLRTRRVLAGLLLARFPESKVIRELAEALGAKKFGTAAKPSAEPFDCVLCGLCVRACRAVGKFAIDFSGRGTKRRVGPPFGKPPEACTGCRACATVCPLGSVREVEEEGYLKILPWQGVFEAARCARCGSPLGTAAQCAVVGDRVGDYDYLKLCPACRRRRIASFQKAGSPA